MKQTLTIARRELSSLFFSPVAYLVLGVFAFGASIIFIWNFGPGQPATLRPTFEALFWLMIFLVPAISMRTLSDEFRSGTRWGIQTSVYTNYQEAVREAARLDQRYGHRTEIFTEQLSGQPRFRIIMGNFERRSEALNLLIYLNRNDLLGEVVTLPSPAAS